MTSQYSIGLEYYEDNKIHTIVLGSFYATNKDKLINNFDNLCSKQPLMLFDNDIEFDAFYRMFKSYKLMPMHSKPKIEFTYNATIPKKYAIVRATLLEDGNVLRSYDFLLRRPLNKNLTKERDVYERTLDLLGAYFEGRYNPNEFIKDPIKIKKNFLRKIKDFLRKPKIFITSDLHLDHKNIIKYCKRPFIDVKDMNETLVSNWNATINKKDAVFFLGDLAYGKGSKTFDQWADKLNGKIIFIKGNHDKSDKIPLYETYILRCCGYEFFLSHRPDQVPELWNGWSIHGHIHNNDLKKYPFIDKEHKKINVSIELTKYKPVSIYDLIKEIEK